MTWSRRGCGDASPVGAGTWPAIVRYLLRRICYLWDVSTRLDGIMRRGNTAAFAWWFVHGAALIVLVLITSAQGTWFWTIGAVLAVSCYAGQVVINRRASRSSSS